MSLELYAAFVAATVTLMLIPGPNVALITATSIAQGWRSGLAVVAGASFALIPQLAMAVFGMNGLLALAGQGLAWLRLLGAAYLVWLGLRAWGSRPADEAAPAPGRSAGVAFRRGFLVSITNPKTLLFYGAFFPQFVTADHPARQLWLMAATGLVLTLAIDSGWALLAARLSPFLRRHGRWRARLTGGVLIGAGAGMALARVGR